MISGFGADNTARKVFDLKIMQSFPIVVNESPSTKLITNGKEVNTEGYQHLSIPPDLQMHLAGHEDLPRIWFDTDIVDDTSGRLKKDLIHLFNWRSRPIDMYKEPKDAGQPKYHGAQLVFLTPDQLFTNRTGISVDLFVHNYAAAIEEIKDFPFSTENTRHAGDNHGNLIGPYEFGEIVKGSHKVKPNYFFTVRLGYHEAEGDCAILETDFPLRENR